MKEVKRRLEQLGLPTEEYPLCFTEGKQISLSEEDKAAIEKCESAGCTVFLVTHDKCEGVVMNNYIYVGDEPGDWEYEWRKATDTVIQAHALVSSELTHGTFDVGAVFLEHINGIVHRVEDYR